MVENISYSQFLWSYILTQDDKNELIEIAFRNLVSPPSDDTEGWVWINKGVKKDEYSDSVEVFLLYDTDISPTLKAILNKRRKEIENQKNKISDSDIVIQDVSEFQFNKILYSEEYIIEQEKAAKIMNISANKVLNKVVNRNPKAIKRKFKQFDKLLPDTTILTVSGYFHEDFNEELVPLLSRPLIWFQWDNIDGMTKIFNTLNELQDEFDESYFESYKSEEYYYQMGVLIEDKNISESLSREMEKFCKLKSGSIDKCEFLETNEKTVEYLYGITLLDGVPALMERFLDNIIISKNTD